MNASIRAWLYAVSHTQVADILKYGQREQAWRDVYHVRRPIHVHALQSWRPLLRNWAQMHRQHDAGEFLEHILGIQGHGDGNSGMEFDSFPHGSSSESGDSEDNDSGEVSTCLQIRLSVVPMID